MTRVHLTLPVCAVIATLFAAHTAQAQTTGYWKWVRTDSGVYNGWDGPIHDSATGGETAITLTDTAAGTGALFAVTLYWYSPPTVLIPGTYPDWRVSGKVVQNSSPAAVIHPIGDDINLESHVCGSNPDPTSYNCGAGSGGPGGVVFYQRPGGVAGNDPVGTVKTSSNLQQPTHKNGDESLYPPQKTPGYNSTGLTWQVFGQVSYGRMWIWHYQYQWVAGSLGSCSGTCTLASPGQTMDANGGPGSVSLTATSTWDVVAPDDWVQVTSPLNGNGNSTVTFTVKPNPGPVSRSTTIIIGGQPYTVSQDGTASSSTPAGLDLHRPKLVVTDTSGNAFTLQPTPGKNDGTDDGSPNAGKDTGVFGQTSGGWQTHNFAKDSPVYVMNSTCNDSTGYAYLQFSLASLPAQDIASAKVQVYAGSMVVNNLNANPADPVFAARRVTSAWDESKMTWSSGQPTYDSTVVDSQTLSGVAGNKSAVNAWLTYDITNLYKGWASGTTPNYGLRFSHENAQCMNGWLGLFYTSNDLPAAQTGASCTYSLSLSAASAAATGGSGAFTMNASAATCTWTASAVSSWLHVVNGASGTGSGPVSYTADANAGSSRQGTITLTGAGQTLTFTVNQAGGGGSTGSDSTCTGTCTLGSPGQPVPATGGPVSVAVTAPSSSWTVAPPTDSWVHLTSPASNNGNSTVTFTVDANAGPSHTSTISIANQPFTIYQNGTPTGTTSGCAYLIQSNTTQNIPNTGTTSGLIQVITAQNCAWTASTAATWITLKSGTSASGNGAVAYTVPQNPTASARSGGILIAGQYVAINQAAGTGAPLPGTPVISAGGVVNTASYAPGGPPSGSLAQGSYFSIYGSTVGPETPVQSTAYPLPNTLGGVSVQIAQGSNKYSAPLVFVYKSQINAILPSNVPVGAAQLTITYNGLTSQPADITVAKTSFGVFFQRVDGKDLAIAQNVKTATDYPLNLPDTPAKPAQIVIFWGTGLGPIAGADNTAPGAAGDMTTVPVTITVGGVTASRLYAGRQAETAAVDNVYFTIPAGVPLGCQVPVVITAGGTPANTTNIAITADGSPCK